MTTTSDTVTGISDNPQNPRKIMIFAGEASGDLQGAMLVRELKKRYPGTHFSGVGGVRMKEEGVELYLDSTPLGVIGLLEGIKLIPRLYGIYHQVRKAMIKTRPDVVILIDTPSLNMRLANEAKKHNIKTVYYFPPSAWSGSVKRAREVGKKVDLVVNAFEFTASTYKKAEVEAFYTGHPLVDFIEPLKRMDRQEILKKLNLSGEHRYIALLPGSRSMEIRFILPLLLDSAEELQKLFPDIRFLMPIAGPSLKEKIEEQLKRRSLPITTFDRKSPEIVSVSELVILASGSAALETGILERPMILTYRVHPLDYFLIKSFVKLKWVGLPNLILQREIIPELLQDNAMVDKICNCAKELMSEGKKREQMLADLKELNKSLGEPGIVSRIADHIGEKLL